MKNKIIVALVVVLGIGGFVYYKNKGDTNSTLPTPQEVGTPTGDVGAVDTNKKYKDGTYSAVGYYSAPSGGESIGISITLKDNKIASATVIPKAKNGTSMRMQEAFKSGFSGYVVGKNVDEVSLSVVNGSSLTPKGFMDALEKIKSEAKA